MEPVSNMDLAMGKVDSTSAGATGGFSGRSARRKSMPTTRRSMRTRIARFRKLLITKGEAGLDTNQPDSPSKLTKRTSDHLADGVIQPINPQSIARSEMAMVPKA